VLKSGFSGNGNRRFPACCFDRLGGVKFSLGDFGSPRHCRQTERGSERREFRLGILGFVRGYLGIPYETKDGNEADPEPHRSVVSYTYGKIFIFFCRYDEWSGGDCLTESYLI